MKRSRWQAGSLCILKSDGGEVCRLSRRLPGRPAVAQVSEYAGLLPIGALVSYRCYYCSTLGIPARRTC